MTDTDDEQPTGMDGEIKHHCCCPGQSADSCGRTVFGTADHDRS